MAHFQVPYQIEILRDVGASRAFGVTYTNSTTKNLYITIFMEHISTAAGGSGLVSLLINGSSTLSSGFLSAPINFTLYASMTFIIKPYATYRLNNTVAVNAVNTIMQWHESA